MPAHLQLNNIFFGFKGFFPSSNVFPTIFPPAISDIKRAALLKPPRTQPGSTPLSNLYEESVESPMDLPVFLIKTGLNIALSRNTFFVFSVTSEPVPPIMPASARGVFLSAITRKLFESFLSIPSSVFIVSPSFANLT